MADKTSEKFLSLVEENQTSREEVIQTASRLYALKKEAPSLVHKLGSFHNLPSEIKSTLDILEKLGTPEKVTLKDSSLVAGIPKDKQQVVASVLGDTVLEEFPVSDSIGSYAIVMGVVAATTSIPVVGTILSGINIFRAMKQKKQFEKNAKEETKVVKSSTNIFNEAIKKMEFLLNDSEIQMHEISDDIITLTEGTKNYDMLSEKQKKELLGVIDKLSTLIEELKQKIEV